MTQATPMSVVTKPTAFVKPSIEDNVVWVAIYLRVSTGRQATHGFGLPVQEEICRQYAGRFPEFRVFGVYTDDGASGTVTDRRDLNRLLADAEKHPIKFVIVAYLNRQSREEYVGYYLDKELGERGVTLVSATQEPDPYHINRVSRGVQRVIDAEDRRAILERTNNGRQESAEAGYWTGGPAPFGYSIIGQGKKRSTLGVNEKEAACLLRAVELIVDEGMNVTRAAAQLNAEGFRPRSAPAWTEGNLNKRLRSEAASGYSTFRKTSGEYNSGRVQTKLTKEGTAALGQTVVRKLPEIIPADRYTLLRAALEKNGRSPDPENRYLLSGYIKGRCGANYHGATNGARRYVCGGKGGTTKKAGCKDIALRADLAESAVWGKLAEFFSDRDRLKKLAQEWLDLLPGDRARHAENVVALEADIEKTRRTLEKLTQQLADPDMDADEAEIQRGSKAALMVAYKLKKNELAQAKDALEEYDALHADVTRVVDLVRDTEVRIHEMSDAEKAVLLKLLRIEVRIVGNDVRSDLGIPSPVEAWHREQDVLVPDDPDDDTWKLAEALLYERERGLRVKRVPPERVRMCLRAILHRLRTGCRWVDLPQEFVPGVYKHWSSVAGAQYAWWDSGTWRELVALLLAPGGGRELRTPRPLPPLEVTGRFNPDLLERSALQVGVSGQASRSLSKSSKIFSFTLQVA